MNLIIRLLDRRGMYFPRTYALGLVEIRNPRSDTQAERDGLRESSRAFGDEDSDGCMRIATIVDGSGTYEAHCAAEERFDEALDVLGAEGGGLSSVALLAPGLALDLKVGRIQPRTPREPRSSLSSVT